jgi:hypothetical protein
LEWVIYLHRMQAAVHDYRLGLFIGGLCSTRSLMPKGFPFLRTTGLGARPERPQLSCRQRSAMRLPTTHRARAPRLPASGGIQEKSSSFNCLFDQLCFEIILLDGLGEGGSASLRLASRGGDAGP